MKYNPAIHNRKSIRLKNYDYAKEGIYFITLCVTNRKSIFGQIINGKMQLNPFGKIANDEWKKTPEIRKNISLGKFIIMPNHMHGIISIDYKIDNEAKNEIGKFKSPSQTIGAIIRGYKGATTKRINNLIREIRKESFRTGELRFALAGNLNKDFALSRNLKKKSFKGEESILDLNMDELQFAPTDNSWLEINLTGEGSIWQHNYYEHIIKTEKAFHNISNYIINNPGKWKNDTLK